MNFFVKLYDKEVYDQRRVGHMNNEVQFKKLAFRVPDMRFLFYCSPFLATTAGNLQYYFIVAINSRIVRNWAVL